jgi:hypothetical protein
VYETERYSLTDLHYKVPISKPGEYVVIVKLSEVRIDNYIHRYISKRKEERYLI